MNPELPDELAELEAALRRQVVLPPAELLRERILNDVRRKLQTAVEPRRSPLWAPLSAAALLFFWLNLAAAACNDTDFCLRRSAFKAVNVSAELRELCPEMDETEIQRQTLLLAHREVVPFFGLPQDWSANHGLYPALD